MKVGDLVLYSSTWPDGTVIHSGVGILKVKEDRYYLIRDIPSRLETMVTIGDSSDKVSLAPRLVKELLR